MKTCNKCNKTKEPTEYKKDPRNKDGLQGICKQCNKEWQQKRRDDRKNGLVQLKFITEKTCNKCHTTKSTSEFYKDAGCADGHSTLCKTCRNISMSKWRDNNRSRYNKNMRSLRANNREWAKDNDLRRTHGISLNQYNEMLNEQNHVCKICKKPPKGKRPLVVDHEHSSGIIRGLLCYGCNRKIALLDAPEEEQKAALEYVKKSKKETA